MRHFFAASLLAATCGFVAALPAQSAVIAGQAAPSFTLKDSQGKTVNLADYAGKYVVLEWHNPDCPFVQKHYRSGNMQALQSRYTQQGVVWLAISSTHPSYAEYRDPAAVNALLKTEHATPTAYLMDGDGKVGMTYGARTTPQMFVINPQGNVVYAGGIDDKRSTDLADVKTAKNYVAAALDEARAGKPVTVANAPTYGCSVKYRS